jgi:transcriptional regulator with XRE-family HTH domain
MDMQIDSKRVRAERERRAWSQEHLSEVSGLALRTIQRVESTGNGSYETVKALAAVFECDVAALRAAIADVARPPASPRSRRYWAAGAAAAAIATLGFFSRPAAAGQVLLDVALTVNEQKTGKHQLITAEGKDAEIRLEGQMRLIVTPRVNADGNILLSIQLFEADGESFELVSEPKVLAVDNVAAVVNLTSAKGSVFGIAITPHRLAN